MNYQFYFNRLFIVAVFFIVCLECFGQNISTYTTIRSQQEPMVELSAKIVWHMRWTFVDPTYGTILITYGVHASPKDNQVHVSRETTVTNQPIESAVLLDSDELARMADNDLVFRRIMHQINPFFFGLTNQQKIDAFEHYMVSKDSVSAQ